MNNLRVVKTGKTLSQTTVYDCRKSANLTAILKKLRAEIDILKGEEDENFIAGYRFSIKDIKAAIRKDLNK